jgi:hypothetical protein
MKELIDIKLGASGMGFTHSLLCWHCKEKPAVYRANPYWDFIPCWDCQSRYVGVWTKKSFWKRLLNF